MAAWNLLVRVRGSRRTVRYLVLYRILILPALLVLVRPYRRTIWSYGQQDKESWKMSLTTIAWTLWTGIISGRRIRWRCFGKPGHCLDPVSNIVTVLSSTIKTFPCRKSIRSNFSSFLAHNFTSSIWKLCLWLPKLLITLLSSKKAYLTYTCFPCCSKQDRSKIEARSCCDEYRYGTH